MGAQSRVISVFYPHPGSARRNVLLVIFPSGSRKQMTVIVGSWAPTGSDRSQPAVLVNLPGVDANVAVNRADSTRAFDAICRVVSKAERAGCEDAHSSRYQADRSPA